MEATCGSSVMATQYDVFLSFRGFDTRNTFTDCLNWAMVGQGVITYRDSEDLHTGDQIDDLLRAVCNSKICIPVLSKGYASSAWCLRELARAIELNDLTGKPEILPIFFDVMPSDVKLRTELYVQDLKKHERRLGSEIRQKWEAALRKVGEIKGWEVQGKAYVEVIELVVREVLLKLKVKQRPLDSKLVGVDEQVKAIMELLDVDSGTGVHFVGIHGIGGIGKTTLAKIVFNELCSDFDGQCSFIGDIRESLNRNGLVDLQKQLACDIFGSRFVEKLANADEWMNNIRRRARCKKVLIVLDDLDKREQLKKLVGGPETFGFGSIIIITTRNKRILDEEEGILAYEVKQMDDDESLKLFSLHAFNSVSPPDTHQSLSQEIVFTTGGLPLALEVIGSYLCHQKEEIWKEMPKRLKNVPHDEVRDKLKISYDELGDMEKEIFLDITCFFINKKLIQATYFWDACCLYPHSSLKNLIDLSLIKIVGDDVIWMHDQLRDLGRDIIRQECIHDLIGRTRLWNDKEALEVIRSKEIKNRVQALNLDENRSEPIRVVDEELKRMSNLKFLNLREGTFVGDVNNHLLELRWLSWKYPPLDCRMANLHLKNLVVFKLSFNDNTENWGGWNILKIANKLKILSLSKCEGLKRTPDFSGCLSLDRLSLRRCSNLREVDSSIGKLKGLTRLDIIRCTSLRTLPEEIGELVNLKHFSIKECSNMQRRISYQYMILPDSIGNAKQLSSFDMSYVSFKELPISIGEFTQLKFLSLHGCERLGGLLESIGNLTSLQSFDISRTNIVELPDSIKNLKQLKVMRVTHCMIRRLPASIGMLESLEELYAYNCVQLAGELPIEIGKLLSLSILDISNTRIRALPTSINSLTQLQKLDLKYCNELQDLPKLPSSLNCLYVQSTSLRLVPDFSNLTNLVELLMSNNFGEAPIQALSPMLSLQLQWVGKLSKLEKLNLCLSNILVPSTEWGCLTQLRELALSMDSFNSIVVGPQFSKLKILSTICIYRCPLREIQLDGLELLRDLAVRKCESLEELSNISPSLRKLCKMGVFYCPKLLEIRFFGMMESLEQFKVECCESLQELCGLSNSPKLKALEIDGCSLLRFIDGLEELELLQHLYIAFCLSLQRLTNMSTSKIPNECRILVMCCGKLPDTDGFTISYGDYKDMIPYETMINYVTLYGPRDTFMTPYDLLPAIIIPCRPMQAFNEEDAGETDALKLGSLVPVTELDSRGLSGYQYPPLEEALDELSCSIQ